MLNQAFLQDIIDSNIKALKTHQIDLTRNVEILLEYFYRHHTPDTAATVLALVTGKYKPSIDSELQTVAVYHAESGAICEGFVEYFSPIDNTYKVRFMIPTTKTMYYPTLEDKMLKTNGSETRYDEDGKRYEHSANVFDYETLRPDYETIELRALKQNSEELSAKSDAFIRLCDTSKYLLRPVYDINALKTALEINREKQEILAQIH